MLLVQVFSHSNRKDTVPGEMGEGRYVRMSNPGVHWEDSFPVPFDAGDLFSQAQSKGTYQSSFRLLPCRDLKVK